MGRYKKQMWNGEGSEPIDFAVTNDPLHGANFESGRDDLIAFASKVSDEIKSWLNDKSRNLDKILSRMEQEWKSQGGNNQTWESVLSIAFQKSGYCRAMSKETKEFSNPVKQETREVIRPAKKEKFNGLDLSNISI